MILKLNNFVRFFFFPTAGFMKTVPSLYTLSVKSIYLSQSTQVAEGIIFRIYTVAKICLTLVSVKHIL